MVYDRNDMICQIVDYIGTDRVHAERIYEALRADGRIYFDDSVPLDRQGLEFRDGLDLMAAASEIE